MSTCNKLFCVVIGSSQCGEVELRGYVLGKVRPKIASVGSLAVRIIESWDKTSLGVREPSIPLSALLGTNRSWTAATGSVSAEDNL